MAGLGLAAGLLPGCPRTRPPLRIGLHPWPSNDLYYLAEQLGHHEGLPVRIVDYASAEQGLQAVRNAVIEAYPCTLDEALLLAADLDDARVVQLLDSSYGADVILAHPDVPSMEALRGRRVGYEATALGAYVLSRSLEIAGLQPTEVTPVFIQIDEHERAYRERRVDAVITYEPVASHLRAAGARAIFDSTQMPGEIVDVLVVRAATLADHADVLVGMVRGWLLAAEALRARPAESAETLAPRMGLPPDRVVEAFATIRLADLAENRRQLGGSPPPIAATAERLLASMLAAGILKRAPDLEPLFDARVVERVSLGDGG